MHSGTPGCRASFGSRAEHAHADLHARFDPTSSDELESPLRSPLPRPRPLLPRRDYAAFVSLVAAERLTLG